MKRYFNLSQQPDASECNGCGVGLLSCPAWRQRHTQLLTFCGRNRAAIGGATEEELSASAQACILCGSCETLCPAGIRTQQATLALRLRLAEKGLMPEVKIPAQRPAISEITEARLLVPGRALFADKPLLERVLQLLSKPGKPAVCAPDDGHDLGLAVESGSLPDGETVQSFMAPLLKASEIVVSDGLLFNLLSSLLPSSIRVRALGPVLLEHPRVRAGLLAGDFLMIETRAYNATRKHAALLYDALRRETGCSMNLDLHRVAAPTGAAGYQHRESADCLVSVEDQVRWLLEGRSPDRIVVEHLDDRGAFAAHTDLLVLHLAEVARHA
jgi:ferredoxin